MSQVTTLTLLPQTPHTSGPVITGTARPGAGYYQNLYNYQTFSWSLTNFTGYVIIQATIVDEPSATDWVSIHTINGSNLTQRSFTNIRGNFTYLRVMVTGFTNGLIDNIKVAY